MNTIYSWSTTKTAEGFRFNVVKIVPRSTPNEIGHYADSTVVKSGLRATRAQAKSKAQEWVRYLQAVA